MTPSGLTWLRGDQRRLDVALAAAVAGIGLLLVLAEPGELDAGWPEVAGVVGTFVVLVLRRRWTFALLGLAMVWVAVHISLWSRPTPMIFGALALTATACLTLDRPRAIGLGVAVAAGLYSIAVFAHDFELGDSRAVILVTWTAVAVGIADATRSWKQYRESVDAQVRSAVLAAEAQSRERVTEERLAIARDLHDLLAHNLSVMNVQTGAALHLLDTDPVQAQRSLTTVDPATLLEAIRVVAAGDALLTPRATRALLASMGSETGPRVVNEALVAQLTAREREVVGLVGRGLSNEEIAEALYLSPLTAKTHVSRSMTKLHARDRAQLVVMALKAGLTAVNDL
jgi:DNA-binding CsgD family transcriptional regulator